MIADYPMVILLLIYIGLYYLSIKTVLQRNITRRKKIYLFTIIFLLPFIGVFVPLFMFAKEDPNDFFYGVQADKSDKVELNNSLNSEEENEIDIE